MIAAQRHIEAKFTIDTHERKLVGVTLIVEELSEIFLRPLDITNVDERYPLSEMSGGIFKSLDRINRIDRIT